ncbi:zinc finger protein 271 [Aplysia californica]|uniref:Zinc finger protein 271 n=1 Tax=Aplysia californica TaxID=6500 RepID=A0ABM0JMN5_APLCA|nr:zinc finger protein 271 [Aplysia californica]
MADTSEAVESDLRSPKLEENQLMDFDSGSMNYLRPDDQVVNMNENSGASRRGRFSSRDRPFACHVCNKRFTQKAHLIIHKRIHTGEKPYACHICHKRFAQSSHLTVHKRVHTGEKPFFCNFCGMGFCRRPRLEAHILQHVVKEGKQLPANFKGDMMGGLSMVGLSSSTPVSMGASSQDSLSSSSEMLDFKSKDLPLTTIKTEPIDVRSNNSETLDGTADECKDGNQIRSPGKDNLARLANSGASGECGIGDIESSSETKGAGIQKGGTTGLGLSMDELDKLASSLTEMTESQKQALSQSLLAQKNQLNCMMNNNNSMMSMNPGLSMSGLVRTNSRVSLIDFTAEDILRHLMSRDDVKSCDFCCIVFHDPAMYYLHRSMHDKMDVRCCNLCGKLMSDKYDFTAHFLSEHK